MKQASRQPARRFAWSPEWSSAAPVYLAASLWLFSPDASGQGFELLDSLGGTTANNALAINNVGQVVGRSATPDPSGVAHAVIWDGTTPTDLGTLGGRFSIGTAVNESGQVAGYSDVIGVSATHATLWNGTRSTDLGTLGGTFSSARGINDAGQVVGVSTRADGEGRAVSWSGGRPSDLGTLGGSNSSAADINNRGQIVGAADTLGDTELRPVLWNGPNGTPIDLGSLGGKHGAAVAINDAGQVAGYSDLTADGLLSHATLWQGGVLTDLGTLGGSASWATAINSSGQVVGVSWTTGDAAEHAAIWTGNAVLDLNGFLDAATVAAGWQLGRASGINDSGWITGDAYNLRTGAQTPYLLSIAAIPEAPTGLTMLLGLGVIATVGLRRQRPSGGTLRLGLVAGRASA